jgi:predicted transcriptional regulator
MIIYRRFAEILMPKTKTIFDEIDQDAEARAIAEAEADVAAGRVVPHEEVVKWLRSWGTPDELPCPVPKPR